MLDHLIGRPSANWRRIQVILVLLGGHTLSKLCDRYNFSNALIVRWNRRLTKFSPLQLILFTLMAVHALNNCLLLVGLEGPEPLAHLYNRSYFRASWILTALDAGFWTAMPIRPRWVRDLLAPLFSFVYLFFPNAADSMVRRFRATVTVEAMRVSWQKQLNPIFNLVCKLARPWFGVKRRVLIPRPAQGAHDDEPIAAYVYFTGAPSAYASSQSIILSIPGGGFVTMPPPCHESYFAFWCKDTNVPIIAIDYKKAPEFPYPYAVNECFDAYRTIVETRGRCLGLDGLREVAIREGGLRRHHTEVPIALVGDSAGGNLATAVMYKILEWRNLARPQGLVLIYPCLNFNISSWMSPGQIKLFRAQSVKSMTSLWEARSHYKHKSPLSTFSDTESKWRHIHYPSIEEQVQTPVERLQTLLTDQVPLRTKKAQLTMTSRMTYFNDRVLTPDLMRTMAILYIGPHNQPDFHNDYYLSPIVGPEHLLAQFPKTYLICGEVDPMVDDTLLFAGRIRQAKLRASRRRNATTAAVSALTPLNDGDVIPHAAPKPFIVGGDESPPPDPEDELILPPVESYTRLYPAASGTNIADALPATSGGIGEEQLGVEVRLLAGMSHAFLSMIPFLPEAASSTKYIAAWFADILAVNSAEGEAPPVSLGGFRR
ncbi:hypothetical protein L0F63_004247 [Massospora cicadina]|nr:hypothetical protein L0F63_004247 [Massospora cicadina]